jgi:hypothetical protein
MRGIGSVSRFLSDLKFIMLISHLGSKTNGELEPHFGVERLF